MQNSNTSRFKQIILSYLLQVKWRMAFAALCLLGVVALQLLAPWPLKIIFDYILLEKPLSPSLAFLDIVLQTGPLLALMMVSSSLGLIAIFRGIFSYFQIYTTTKIGYELVYTLRRELFSHLQRLSLSFHHQSRTGEILTKISSDTTTLRDMFADWALTIAAHVLTVFGMLTIMFLLNWQLSLVVLFSLPVMAVVLLHLNQRVKASIRTQRKQEGKMSSRVNEVLASISLVQAFGREGYEEDRYDTESSKNLEASIQTARTTASISKAVLIISAIGTAGTVFFGAWQVLKNQMTPGDLLVFTAYVKSLYRPVKDLGKLSAKYSRATVSANRISDMLDVEPDIRDHPQAIQASSFQGDIRFQEVSFAYATGNTVLDRVSFHIRPGQRIALVGGSGAGKSTIVSLILRLYDPQEGAIFIDGRDVTVYQRESLRQEFGIVLQDTVLFGASVEENISYGKPGATREEVETAARQAHAHDFIMSLPDGYDAIVGEKGGTLSGGQRQRICLARAFIKQPSILVLDEPTSAIDPISASLIREAIEKIQYGKTTLFIAHQFSAMNQFDQILVLKNGHIVEHGPHADLLSLKGHYYDLYHKQIA